MKILKGLKREFGHIRTGLDVIADAFIGMAGYVEPHETIIYPQYRDILPPQQTHEAWLKQDMQLYPGCYPKPRLKVIVIKQYGEELSPDQHEILKNAQEHNMTILIVEDVSEMEGYLSK